MGFIPKFRRIQPESGGKFSRLRIVTSCAAIPPGGGIHNALRNQSGIFRDNVPSRNLRAF